MQRGSYYPSTSASNNSIVLSSLTCCHRVELYCYSNSTTESEKYLIWPDGTRLQPDRCHYCEMCISRRFPSGMYIYSYSSYHPGTGIYTCQLQDSNGNLIDISFGVYSSMPRELFLSLFIIIFNFNSVQYTEPPSITAMKFTSLMDSTDNADSSIANVTCITENSPPTNVTWMMDGSVLEIDGQNYRLLQTVTDRRRSQYRATLLIRNLFSIIGTHDFTCLVSNIAGSTSGNITTYLPGIHAYTMYIAIPQSVRGSQHCQKVQIPCTALIRPFECYLH